MKLSITTIRANSAQSVSIRTSSNGNRTLSATIHGVDGPSRKARNATTGKLEVVSMDEMYYGLSTIVTLTEDQVVELEKMIATHFQTSTTKGSNSKKSTNPRVGITFEVSVIGNPSPGVHPATGLDTLNVLVPSVLSVISVYEGEEFLTVQDIEDMAAAAALNTSERSKTALAESSARKATTNALVLAALEDEVPTSKKGRKSSKVAG